MFELGYWHQRTDEMLGSTPLMITINQEPLVVEDKVARAQVSLG